MQIEMHPEICLDARAAAVWHALATVTDPEIPVINIVEMGMVAGVRFAEFGVIVDFTPTFAGCPALDVIRTEIREAVKRSGEADVSVNVVFHPPWTTERITEEGRRKLKGFGLAPPGRSCGEGTGAAFEARLATVPCPHCNSANTDLESLFGPTLCRSIHYCRDCRQSFEHFKEV